MVPRSTSAATAIDPRLIAQMAMIKRMKRLFQKVMMIETEGGCSFTPKLRIHWTRFSSESEASALRISASLSEVT